MSGVIVVLPKSEDARNMKNLLARNGIEVAGVCTTGAQAIAQAENFNDGIVLCGYKLPDMLYSQLKEYLPPGFEMLLLASRYTIENGLDEEGLMCLSMPLKVHELIGTVSLMLENIQRRRRKRREKPRERSEQETKLIKQAKELLMARNHMTEEEAHRYLQKCSMDSGTNMVEAAQMVLMMKG